VHEPDFTQYYLDFRTGRPSCIQGQRVEPADRAACTALNRRRARGLQEAARQAPSREPLSPHVWSALVARRCAEWGVPLVSLPALGISADPDGFLSSKWLKPLKAGAEACPFLDPENGVVYKLFPLHVQGGLGKSLFIEWIDEEQRFESSVVDATLDATLEKLMALHDAGAHPTEIVGLADDGNYLIIKQPEALAFENLDVDRVSAVETMKAIRCDARFNTAKWVFWLDEQAWVMSDLHPGNIMREAEVGATIIDALAAPLSPFLISKSAILRQAVEEARALREGRVYEKPRGFDDVNDDDL
jgi:hypothetical protein